MNTEKLNAYLDCCEKLRRRIKYLSKENKSTESTKKMLDVIELILLMNMEKQVAGVEDRIKEAGEEK